MWKRKKYVYVIHAAAHRKQANLFMCDILGVYTSRRKANKAFTLESEINNKSKAFDDISVTQVELNNFHALHDLLKDNK